MQFPWLWNTITPKVFITFYYQIPYKRKLAEHTNHLTQSSMDLQRQPVRIVLTLDSCGISQYWQPGSTIIIWKKQQQWLYEMISILDVISFPIVWTIIINTTLGYFIYGWIIVQTLIVLHRLDSKYRISMYYVLDGMISFRKQHQHQKLKV